MRNQIDMCLLLPPFKAHVKHEDLDGDLTQQTQVFKATGHKPKGPATAQIAVRTFTDSSGGATDSAGTSTESEDHTPLSCSSSDSSSSNAEWHDCVEEWGACTSAAGFNCQPHQAEAEADSYAGLPAELTTIVKSYQQVRCGVNGAPQTSPSCGSRHHSTAPPLPLAVLHHCIFVRR